MWFSFYFILQMSAKQIVKRSIYNIKDNLYYTNIEKNLINKLTVCYLFSACADMGLCHKKKKTFYIKFTGNRKYSSVNCSLFQSRQMKIKYQSRKILPTQSAYQVSRLFCLHFILPYLCIPALTRKLLLAFTRHTRKGES